MNVDFGNLADWVGIGASSIAAGVAAWVAWREHRRAIDRDKAETYASTARHYEALAELRLAVVSARDACQALITAADTRRDYTEVSQAWWRDMRMAQRSAAAIAKLSPSVSVAVQASLTEEVCAVGDLIYSHAVQTAEERLPRLNEQLREIETLQATKAASV